jgi:SAM-dependent methyltransferase
MDFHTTEVTSLDITYEKPIHSRLLFGYVSASNYIKGSVLELGCGVGRGIEILQDRAESYTAIDKNKSLLETLARKYPKVNFVHANIPPFKGVSDNSFDTVVTFHVIEHIKDDQKFVDEIYRVLKPGGMALISTPNKHKSFARNPWHIREYTKETLSKLVGNKFSSVEMKGIAGNEKVQAYMDENKKNVDKIMRFDVLNLQWILPAVVLQKPYEILNKRNRKKLLHDNQSITSTIEVEDYYLTDDMGKSWDLFAVLTK